MYQCSYEVSTWANWMLREDSAKNNIISDLSNEGKVVLYKE